MRALVHGKTLVRWLDESDTVVEEVCAVVNDANGWLYIELDEPHEEDPPARLLPEHRVVEVQLFGPITRELEDDVAFARKLDVLTEDEVEIAKLEPEMFTQGGST